MERGQTVVRRVFFVNHQEIVINAQNREEEVGRLEERKRVEANCMKRITGRCMVGQEVKECHMISLSSSEFLHPLLVLLNIRRRH